MTVLVAVGISVGGALGALARWRLDVAVREWLLTRANAAILHRATPARSAPAVPAAPMPGIGVVNVLGCLFIGLITGVVAADSPAWLVLSTGFLGGFTTFSTAVVDGWTLWRARRRAAGIALAFGMWALSLAAVLVGLAIAGAIH